MDSVTGDCINSSCKRTYYSTIEVDLDFLYVSFQLPIVLSTILTMVYPIVTIWTKRDD